MTFGLLASPVRFRPFARPVAALAALWARKWLGQRFVRQLRARENRLAQDCALLRDALENIGDGLAAFDRSGRMVLSNHQFFAMLDLPRGVEVSTTLRDVLVRQARRGDFGAGDPAHQAAQRIDAFYRHETDPAERFEVGGRTVQLRRCAMAGGVVLALYSDITDRKAAEDKLTQAWFEADLANRTKSEFLANMSHELRTPLNAIIGFSEIISEQMLGPVGDKYLEYVRDVHASGLHLLSIVNDVLDMSKIEAGKLELRCVPVEVGALLDEAVRMVAERARSHDIRVRIAELGADRVVADERAIKQIVLNLLSNAVKFSRDRDEIEIYARTEPDGSFSLAVEDHGIGMTEAGIERALQPFGQVNSPATRTQSGTGLGLPITKGLVEAHGGRLTIDSVPGRGTTVRVILPPPAEAGAAPAHDERAVA